MSANRRDLIGEEVEKRWRRLRDLSKEVLDHELDNGERICEAFLAISAFSANPGMFRFSSERKRVMRRLFKELRPLMLLESPDETTFAQQCLKKNLMTSPHDLRGSRRLSVMFSMMQVTTISLDE